MKRSKCTKDDMMTNGDNPTILHGLDCKCARCQVENVKEPDIKYTWYKTKTSMMTISSIEYDGRSWKVNFTVKNRFLPAPTQQTWTVPMWNRYSERWRENGGKKE